MLYFCGFRAPGALANSDTSNTVYVAFYIDDLDEWTDALPLFSGGSDKGCVDVCSAFVLENHAVV